MTDRTRVPGPDQHLGADTLADLQEGLLEPGAALAAEDHLLRCTSCAADRRVLADVPRRLAAAGDAGPVPPDVARRINDALADEPPVLTSGAATVTPLAPRRTAPAGMRVLQAAAVLVVLFAGVGIALGPLGGSDDDAATTAKSAAEDSAAQALPDDGSFPVTASGRSWTQESLVAAVPRLLAGTVGPPAPAEAAEGNADTGAGGSAGGSAGREPRSLSGVDAGRLAGGPALADCVTALNDDPVTPLAVDLATWQGEPAAVIVLPTRGDPGSVDEWVVGPDCSLADAKVLYFARAPRP